MKEGIDYSPIIFEDCIIKWLGPKPESISDKKWKEIIIEGKYMCKDDDIEVPSVDLIKKIISYTKGIAKKLDEKYKIGEIRNKEKYV